MEDNMSTTSSSSTSSYDKLAKNGSSRGSGGGFRLHPRRFSVHRLRRKILSLVRFWRNSYRHTLRHLRIGFAVRKIVHHFRTPRNPNYGCSPLHHRYGSYFGPAGKSAAAAAPVACRSMNHSNSFCSEAIADCLEFIKRNSISLEDYDTNPMLKLG